MLKRIVLLCILIATIALSSFPSHAEPPPPPEPWYIEFSNGKIFYMTPENYEGYGYPPSGLYYNGELIYSIDRYRYFGLSETYFAYDGSSFIFMPDTGWNWVGIFVREGIERRTYTFEDVLIRPDDISETTIGFIWDNWRLRQHDMRNNTLQIRTIERRQLVFDLTTGEITIVEENTRVWPVIFMVIAVFSIAIVIFILRSRKIKA